MEAIRFRPRRFVRAMAAGLVLSAALPQPASAAADCTEASDTAPLALAELRQAYGREKDRWLDMGGAMIRYRDEGTGPVVVLLHGSYASLDAYDMLANRLAARHRVVRFDMPGMGLSDPVAKGIHGDDVLAALLDKLAVPRATLVGTSSGGAIAYVFAGRFPARVDALVLANVPAGVLDAGAVPRSAELAAARERVRASGQADCAYWLTYLRWLAWDPVRVSDATIVRTHDMNRRADTGGRSTAWRLTSDRVTIDDALARVTAPTLLYWGLHDAVLPKAAMDDLAARLTAAPLSTVAQPDVGHYPPFEVPDRFAVLVEAWLWSSVFAASR